MSSSNVFQTLQRAEKNAAVIFDEGEPVGQPTDMVLPYRSFFARFRRRHSNAPAGPQASEPNEQ